MKKFLSIFVVAMMVAGNAHASTSNCDALAAAVEATKTSVIEQADNIIVPQPILGDARDSLNGLMDTLNSSGLSEEICPVGELSARIAQTLQAVSNLEQRNSERLASAAS